MPVVMAVNSLDIATTQREYNTCWYLYLALIWWTEKLLSSAIRKVMLHVVFKMFSVNSEVA